MSPAAVDGPRLARDEEFSALVSLVDRCFGFVERSVVDRLPHCFDRSHVDRHAVVTVDDRVVSHAVCVPVQLIAGTARIDCCGIAGVATDPAHRGSGYMGALLEFWLDRIDDRGVPLAELEGDRVRYRRFGWENAGRERRYRVTTRSIAASAGSEPTDEVRRFDGAASDLELVREVHEQERFRVARDPPAYETLLASRRELETFLVADPAPAYATVRPGRPPTVVEFGGSRTGVEAILSTLCWNGKSDELVLYTHPLHRLNGLFHAISADWRDEPHRKLNIRDLTATLDAFAPLLEERWRLSGNTRTGELTIGLTESTDAVALSYGPDGVAIERTAVDPAIHLDRSAMTELLFGLPGTTWPLERSDPFLTTTLPLDVYFWRTETI